MAIGDTVQAGLMRIDTSAYERAGQANANANMAFGNALNQVAKGFIEGQEKRARAEEMTGYLMNQGVSEKDAKAIAKNPFLQKEYQRKKATEAQMQMEGNRLQMEAQKLAAQQKQSSDQAFQKNREMDMKEELFSTQQDKIREDEESATNIAKFNLDRPELPITEETPAAFLPELDPDPFVGPPTTYQGQAPAVAQLPESFQPQGAQVVDAVQSGQLSPLEGNRIMNSIRGQAMAEQKAAPSLKDAIDLKNKEETTRQLFDKPLNDLSANFDKNKQVQDYKNVVISYNTISSAAENPSAAGDLSLIFQYMKVLDPGSTVREGEFANAQNAAGVPDRIRNMFNNWSKGQRLDEKQRQDFITQAKKIVEARGKSIDPLIRQTRQKFDRTINKQNRNLTPDQANLLFEEVIFPDIRLPQNAQPQGQPPQVPSVPQARTLPGGGIFTPIAQ